MGIKKLFAGLTALVCSIVMLPAIPSVAAGNASGDPDGDGKADALDAALILEDAALVGAGMESTLTSAQKTAADVDDNNSINALDAALVLGYSAAVGTGEVTTDLETYLIENIDLILNLKTPVITVAAGDGEATISWAEDTDASGYEVYRCSGTPTSDASFTRLKKLTRCYLTSFTHTGLNANNSYYYKVRAFKEYGGNTYFGEFSNVESNTGINAMLNGIVGESRTSFTVYNRQKSEAELTSYTKTLSENDIAILEAFAAEHFPAHATQEDKLWITLDWINKNVQYAYAGDLWNEIVNLSWTEAIFVNQKGQCAQYNGAMASMMTYLGYDVSVVQGYRGTWPSNYWQHFWVEINIGGTLCIMECGNDARYSGWYYFLIPYEETSGYIRHQQNMG